MQQQKHLRIFRPGLSVKDGETVYLDGAIKVECSMQRSFRWAWARS